MDSQENKLNDLQRHSAIQDARIGNLETQVAAVVSRVDMLVGEMREQNKMRAEEIAEIRKDIKEINNATDAKIAEIRNSVDGMGKHVRNISIAAFVGIGAMVVTAVIGVAAMIWTVINK